MGYSILIYYCEVDEIYVAKVLELEGCLAHGDTQEEALKEIKVAMELWQEVAREEGDSIPKPNGKQTSRRVRANFILTEVEETWKRVL